MEFTLPDTRTSHCLFLGRILFEGSNRPNPRDAVLEIARRSYMWTWSLLKRESHVAGSTISETRILIDSQIILINIQRPT